MNVVSLPSGAPIQASAPPPLPHSVETEQSLLGACLINGEAIDVASDIIGEDDFYDPVHGKIWTAICAMREAGNPVTVTLLKASFGQDANVELAPGRTLGQYFAALLSEAVSVLDTRGYATTIKHLSDCRRIIAAANEAADAAMLGMVGKPADIASGAISALDAIVTSSASKHVKSVKLGQATSMALERCEEIAGGKAKAFDISWGLRTLNSKTNGLEAGDLIIVGARPGMGKTTFGLSVALDMAKAGQAAYFVSLEMSAQQLGQRALTWRTFGRSSKAITYRDIRGGSVDSDQIDVMRAANEYLGTLPIIVEQQPSLTLGQVGARARRHMQTMARAGTPIRVMIVDHLGIMAMTNRYKGNRVNEVGEITSGLKALGKELGIAIIALCQLSRAAEGRDDRRPVISDFRDSGTIEQDADIMIGLYREGYYLDNKKNLTPEETELLMKVQNQMEAGFLKQRQGPVGVVNLFASMPCNHVSDLQN